MPLIWEFYMLAAGEIGEPVSGINLVVPVSTDIVARSSRLVLDSDLCSFVLFCAASPQ
jgi:hypothetical protein